jgi:hypothetical protein
MLAWLRRLRTAPEAPLTGVPAVRRLKSYSAASGFVYQYVYEGQRPAVPEGEPGTEYVFGVSADRRTWSSVRVFLGAAPLEGWQRDHARELNSTERYAVAKMVLFQAFDERASPAEMCNPVSVRPADLTAIAEQLGFI